jgi:hypothetical protein
LQYKRIFAIKPIRRICTIIITVLVAWGIWTLASAIFLCVPVSKFWNPSQPGACMNKEAIWFSNAAVHILTDIVILILPIPVLNSLHLPRRQKYALMVVFAVGGL